MQLTLLATTLALLQLSTCHPAQVEQPQPVKRQNNDYSALLTLASEAGIAVPTDPAVLLSIAPIAASLNSLLPTAPVLSMLETAAPSGLLSSLVHDPQFAASWISSFEQGPSPSWFLALPTSVRSYLHTYADGGNLEGVATAAAGIQSVESVASSAASVSSASVSSLISAFSAANSSMVASSSSASAASAGMATEMSMTGMSTAGATAATGGTSSANTESTSSATVSSSLSTAGAPRETGALAAGAAAMVGILGLAIAL